MITYAIVPDAELTAAEGAKFRMSSSPFVYVIASETVIDNEGIEYQHITDHILMRVLEHENWGQQQEDSFNKMMDAHNKTAKAAWKLDKAGMKGNDALAADIVNTRGPKTKS